MRSVPADESSSNRESVLRSRAMVSLPLAGVLRKKTEGTHTHTRGEERKIKRQQIKQSLLKTLSAIYTILLRRHATEVREETDLGWEILAPHVCFSNYIRALIKTLRVKASESIRPYLQPLQPLRSMSSSGVDSIIACTSDFSVFSTTSIQMHKISFMD